MYRYRAKDDVKINVRFKDTYGLEKFLYSSVHRVLVVETCDTKLELIRVFDISLERLDTKNISFLHWIHLKCLLNENDDVIAKLSDVTIIEASDCKTMDQETKQILQRLSECLSNNALSKKVILIHGSNRLCFCSKCADFITEYNFFKVKKITSICFEDLTEEAQQSFLNEYCICFRGNPMSLKEFLPCEGVKLNNIITTTVINESMFNWRTNSLIKIGSPNIYNNEIYIKRKFHNHFVLSSRVKRLLLRKNITPDLFIISGVENKVQLDAILKVPLKRTDKILDSNNILTFKNSEEALSYFDRQPSSRPTHFIKCNSDGLLIWTASKGSLGCLPHYVYRNRASFMNEQELLLKKAVVLSGALGTGKSTTLAARAYRAKSWIINVDMSDRKSIINRLPKIIDESNVVKFLSHWVEPHFLVNGLLHYYLFNSTESFVYILFDEFDQIADNLDCGSYTCFTQLLKFLKENSQAHVWITARPENSSGLENALSEFSTEFRQMSLEEEQVMLGRNRLMPNLGDLPSFIGRPIVLKLLRDIVEFENVFTLLNNFITDKIERYIEVYFKSNPNKEQIITYLHTVHEFAASILELSGNRTVTLHVDDDVDICRVGFVSSTTNNNFQFVHSIFAQYFASNMIYKWMQNPASCPMKEFLFVKNPKILVEPQFRIIRFFLNHRIKLDMLNIGVKKSLSEYWNLRCNKRALNVLAEEGLFNIVQCFFREDGFFSSTLPLIATRNLLTKMTPLCKAAFSLNDALEDECYKHVFLAIKTYKLDDVKDLLNSTSDLLGLVYKSSSPSKNALHLAAKLGHKEIVEYLLEIAIPVDIVDYINATPLQHAAANGHLDIVKLLLSKGSNINQHDNHSKTAFFRSIEKGKFNVAQLLLKEDSLDVAAVDKNGMTALEHAAKLGDKDIVQQLLLKGCNVNHRDHFGMNALAWAVTTGQSEMVDFLMSLGASSDIRDWNGRNLIYIAIKAKQSHLVPYLTFCLINVNVPDWNNVTPLEVAIVECKNWDVVEHLILEGACVANNGFDPISFTIEAGKPRIALLMVERGSCSIVSLPQELKETLLNEIEGKAEATDYESLLRNLIKMGSVELLRYFIDKKGCAALSETYEELILSGVNLSEEMKSFVERKLVRLRSVTGQTLRLSKEDVDNRISFVCEQIAQLKNRYLTENSDVDPQCIIRMRFIAQNIELLKRAVKDENIPWEQMEFCLVIFMNFFVKPCKEDFIYRLVLDQEKLIIYLDTFALYLNDKNSSLNHWERLETDYRVMKDIYSLNRISHYMKLAVDIKDYKDEVNTFVLMRCLQVIGESFKNTHYAPNLSNEVHDYLVFHAPENVKRILTSVRDHLSHSFSYKLKTNVENNLKSDPEYFQTIQNELKKIRLQTDFLLYRKKKEILQLYHKKCLELEDKSGSLHQINRYINWEFHEQIVRDDSGIMDLKIIKKFIQKLKQRIPNNVILIKLQAEIDNIEKFFDKRLDEAKSNYFYFRIMLANIHEVQHIECMQSLKLDFGSETKKNIFQKAVILLYQLLAWIRTAEMSDEKYEVILLVSQLLYLMKWDIHRIKTIQEIHTGLSGKPDKRSEINLDNLFTKLENVLENNEDKHLLNTHFSNKKKLHIELEQLKHQPDTASINQLNIPNKDKANLKKSLMKKKHQLFNNLIINLDDYGRLLTNLNNDEKFPKLLTDFCSCLESTNINNIIDKFIDEDNNNFQQIFISKLRILSKIISENKTNLKQNMSLQAASEILLLDVMEACSSKGALVSYDLSFDEFTPVLVDTALRNYLAHGTPLTDSLPFDPINALISTVDILSENEANLFKPLAKPSLFCFSDSPRTFTKCFDMVAKQFYWNKTTMTFCKANDEYLYQPSMSNRPFTSFENVLEAANTGDLNTITRLIENISKQTLIKNNKPRKLMNVAIIWPAIVVASKNGHRNIVTSLLKFIDNNSHSHTNPIMDPSISKAIAKQLLRYEIETPFTTIPYDKNLLTTAFRLSAQNGHHDIVKVLIEYGANVNASDKNHMSTLHLASEAGHELVVKTLLENDADVNAKTPDQITPLHMAAVKGYHKTAKVLIEYQAIVDAPRQKDLCTPLHIAAAYGHAKLTNLLLEHRADVNKLTIDHYTALQITAKNNRINIAQILLKHKANVNILTKQKEAPLHLATARGSKDMAQILLENQAHINYPHGEVSPLHTCALYDQKEMTEMLLERQANTEALDTNKLTALHLASMLGNTEVVETLLRYKANINATTNAGFTPLHYACQFGHKSVATVLIGNKANVNATDLDHCTPLHLAASNGHVTTVKVLLENHANVEAVDNFRQTPLHFSAENGHEVVVKVLLDYKSDIHAQSTRLITPLHCSAAEGHENVVRLLLQHKANVKAKAEYSFTPLHLAVQNGHEIVAKLLIEHHANVNALTDDQMTPFHFCVEKGHMGIFHLFLKNNADIHAATAKKFTPLHFSAASGHIEISRELLKHGTNVNAMSINHWTVLHVTAEKGHDKVVSLLLEHNANVNAQGKDLLTPLHLAVENGHKNVAKILIEHHANVNSPNVHQATPFHICVKKGHIGMFQLFLKNNADIHAATSSNFTPLHFSSNGGHSEITRKLLERGANVDATSVKHWTALHGAAEEGHENVVRLLLEYKANVNAQDKNLFTPLHLAVLNGHTNIADLLIEQHANVNASSVHQETPFHICVKKGHMGIFQLFMKNNADIHAATATNFTPLHFSAINGHSDITRELLEHGADVGVMSLNHYTALHGAAEKGHENVVNVLLEYNANVNAQDENLLTPLHLAVQNGHTNIANLLVEHHANVNASSSELITPLHLAVQNGNEVCVRLLLARGADVNAVAKNGTTPILLATDCKYEHIVELLHEYQNENT